MNSPVIDINKMGMVYTCANGEKVRAINEIDLHAEEGEFISIVGPSGCGKTTLLRIISGLLQPTTGDVVVNGKKVKGPNRDVGIVFQEPVLLEWRTIIENVLLPIEIRNEKRKKYYEQALSLLKFTGLEGFENQSPWALSGGMRQRACICRALLNNPSVLLMDEPFGALDAFTRDQMNLELLRIWRGENEAGNGPGRKEKTIIFITHSIQEAVFLSDRVVVLSSRPSTMLKIYDIPFHRPRTEDVVKEKLFGELVFEITDVIKDNCGDSLYA